MFDSLHPVSGARQAQSLLQLPDWEDERCVVRALKKAGHRVSLVAVAYCLDPLLESLRTKNPDVVINFCESFRAKRVLEVEVAACLETLQVPFTGSSARVLSTCKDKVLTKNLVSQYLEVAEGQIIGLKELLPKQSFSFPVIVKPVSAEASEGIGSGGICNSLTEVRKWVKKIRNEFNDDVLVESFIPGKDVTIGVLGGKKPEVWEPLELCVPESAKIATPQIKWDEEFRKKHGVEVKPCVDISSAQKKQFKQNIYDALLALNLDGYARLDFRRRLDGSFVFLEVNPNPGIASDEEFSLSAAAFGLTYEHLLGLILDQSGVFSK